jgi:hypothetical protein
MASSGTRPPAPHKGGPVTAAGQHHPVSSRRALRRGVGVLGRLQRSQPTAPQGNGHVPPRAIRRRFRRLGGRHPSTLGAISQRDRQLHEAACPKQPSTTWAPSPACDMRPSPSPVTVRGRNRLVALAIESPPELGILNGGLHTRVPRPGGLSTNPPASATGCAG